MNDAQITLFGNVVDDPRHTSTSGGAVLTKFRLAHTPRVYREGQWQDGPTSFYDVACWNRMADNVAGSIAKGEPVLVHGRLSVREWETENGRGRSVEISAEHLGHDLRFGTSAFRRPARPMTERPAEFETPTDSPVDAGGELAA